MIAAQEYLVKADMLPLKWTLFTILLLVGAVYVYELFLVMFLPGQYNYMWSGEGPFACTFWPRGRTVFLLQHLIIIVLTGVAIYGLLQRVFPIVQRVCCLSVLAIFTIEIIYFYFFCEKTLDISVVT